MGRAGIEPATLGLRAPDDKIYGQGGSDVLDGGSGKDKLYGDNGKDVLDGGAKKDTLNGGKGKDKAKNPGPDVLVSIEVVVP